MAKKKPTGINGSGFSKDDWAELEALAEKHSVVWSALNMIKTVFSHAHIESFKTLNETISFLNKSLDEVNKLDETSRPRILDNNKEKEFDAIIKVANAIPKINSDLAAMRQSLLSAEDEGVIEGESLSDTWANIKRKG